MLIPFISPPLQPTWAITNSVVAKSTSSATSANVNYPASIAAGDLLVIIGRLGATEASYTASGFTNHTMTVTNFCLMTKTAVGTESGSVNVSWPTSAYYGLQMLRIRPSEGVPRLADRKSGSYADPSPVAAPTKYGFDITITMSSSWVPGTSMITAPTGFTNITYETTDPNWWSGYNANHDGTSTITHDWNGDNIPMAFTVTVS